MIHKKIVHLIMAISIICFCSGCAKEIFDISVNNKSIPVIPEFHYKYNAIMRQTGKKIGYSEMKLSHIRIDDHLMYKMIYRLRLQWKTEHYNETRILIIESESTVDQRFKLVYFKAKLIDNEKKAKNLKVANQFIREGYYQKPYFYLQENNKKLRFRASKGIFSRLIEEYLIRHVLKEPGDAVVYHYLNLSTLEVEEERIIFDEVKHLQVGEQIIPIKIIITRNYTNYYVSTYWVNMANVIIKKTDFKEALIHELEFTN